MITSRSDCSAVSTSPEEMPPHVAVRVQWDSALLSSHEGSCGLPVPDFREAESTGGTRCSRRLPCGPGLQVPHHKRVSRLEDSLKDKCCTRKCPVVTGQPLCLTFHPILLTRQTDDSGIQSSSSDTCEAHWRPPGGLGPSLWTSASVWQPPLLLWEQVLRPLLPSTLPVVLLSRQPPAPAVTPLLSA